MIEKIHTKPSTFLCNLLNKNKIRLNENEVKNMSTMDNLNEAFAGESKANRKYLAYAKKLMKKDTLRWPSSSAQQPKLKLFTHITI